MYNGRIILTELSPFFLIHYRKPPPESLTCLVADDARFSPSSWSWRLWLTR